MSNRTLTDYVNKELERGVSREDVKQALIDEGWSGGEVDGVMASADLDDSKPAGMVDSMGVGHNIIPPEQPIVTSHSPGGIGTSTKASSSVTAKKKRRIPKSLIIGLVVLAILIIAAYITYNKVYLSPERIVSNMLSATEELKSFEYVGDLDVKIDWGDKALDTTDYYLTEEPPLMPEDVYASTTGAVDFSDPDNIKISSLSEIKAGGFSAGKYSLVLDGTDLFIKILDLGLIGTFTGINLEESDWIRLDLNKYLEENVSAAEQVNEENTEILQTAFNNYNFIQLGEKLEDEVVGGVDSFHLSYTIDKSKLEQFMLEVINGYSKEDLDDDDKILISESIAQIKSVDGEIWVSKADYYPTGIIIRSTTSNINSNESYDVSYKLILSSHNQTNLVQIPSSYVEFDSFLDTYLSDFGIINDDMVGPPLESDLLEQSIDYDISPDYLPQELQ